MSKRVLILLVCLFLQSCSINLAYNYADWWLAWKIGDFVTLNSEQKDKFNNDVDAFFDWHRKNELPHYIEKLQLAKSAINNNQPEKIDQLYATISDIWQRSMFYLTPVWIKHMRELNRAQKLELVANIETMQLEQHVKWRQQETDNNTEDKQKQALAEVEEYLGELTLKQKSDLFSLLEARTPLLEYRIKSREIWLVKLSQLLLTNTDLDGKLLTELVTQPETYRSKDYISLSKQNSELNKQWINRTLNSLTESQKQHLIAKIDELIDDLAALLISG